MPVIKAVAGLMTAMVAAGQISQPGVTASRTKTDKPAVKTSVAKSTAKTSVAKVYVGTASWYGEAFRSRRTASGERFNPDRSTIASRHLPFGTKVRVTYLRTGRSAVAHVNDRGPFVRGRIIDCSEGLARQIGLRNAGTGKVKVEVLKTRR